MKNNILIKNKIVQKLLLFTTLLLVLFACSNNVNFKEYKNENNKNRHIIIDSDTGADDASAIILAAKENDIDILGVTVLAGNVDLAQSAKNALAAIEVAGRKVPVYEGADSDLSGNRKIPFSIFGKDGMGDMDLVHPTGKAEEMNAVDFIIDSVKKYPNEVELVCLGPATNIANAIKKDSETMKNVKMIWSMGTTGLGHGNATPVSEFNVYSDSLAYKIMLDSKIPITIIGIDACKGDTIWTDKEFETLYNSKGLGEFVSKSYIKIREAYKNANDDFPAVNCDVVAMMAALYPEFILKSELCDASCVADEGETYGEVIFYRQNHVYDAVSKQLDYHVNLVTEVDGKNFFKNFLKKIESGNNVASAYDTSKNALNSSNGYTVQWVNYDGTILEIDKNVGKNEYPYFDVDIPVKEKKDGVYYTFAGWQPQLSKVNSDVTYTALFEETDRKVEDGMEIGQFTSDDSLLNIAIMTDPHVPYESRYKAFGRTNAELFKNRIENAIDKHGANAILVSGDLTRNSKSEEYDLYNEVISNFDGKCDFVTAAGNHEFRFTIGGVKNRRSQFKNIYAPRWRTKMQTGLYFSQWLGDTHVVAIGDDYYDTDIKDSIGKKVGYNKSLGYISSSEIDWLENIIKEDDSKGITTIVLCHWPIIGTKNGSSHPKSNWATQNAENRIKSIISKHDNVILFSGHTHGAIKGALPVQVENGGMFVHAGAITSKNPTYVSMKQVETDKSIKKYELKYILPTNESQTFVFSHDVPSKG